MVFKKIVVLMMGCLGLAKQQTQPVPQPKTGESSTVGVEVCSSLRIKLNDGRFLAYTERGVPKNKSNYRIIVVHGFASSKDMHFMASQVSNFCLLMDLQSCYIHKSTWAFTFRIDFPDSISYWNKKEYIYSIRALIEWNWACFNFQWVAWLNSCLYIRIQLRAIDFVKCRTIWSLTVMFLELDLIELLTNNICSVSSNLVWFQALGFSKRSLTLLICEYRKSLLKKLGFVIWTESRVCLWLCRRKTKSRCCDSSSYIGIPNISLAFRNFWRSWRYTFCYSTELDMGKAMQIQKDH